MHIWETNGPPSATNAYLWNGDFVDRCVAWFGVAQRVVGARVVVVNAQEMVRNDGFALLGVPVGSGAFGTEVILVLFAWRLASPGSVLLNRGNHEDRNQNMYYNRGQHGCWVRHLTPH